MAQKLITLKLASGATMTRFVDENDVAAWVSVGWSQSITSGGAAPADPTTAMAALGVQVATLANTAAATALQVAQTAAPTPGNIWPLAAPVVQYSLRGLGVDPADASGNTIWFSNSNALFISTDGGATVTQKSLPTGVTNGYTIMRVIRFGGALLMQAQKSDGSVVLLRSTDTMTSWTTVLTYTAGALSFPYNLSCDSQYAYTGDYGDPLVSGSPAASVYRSSDGVTWSKVKTFDAGTRHVHCVRPDPFNPGHVWMAVGDNITNGIWRSTDYGTTWAALANMGATRLIDNLTFSAQWVFGSPDNAKTDLIVIDRATLTPRNGVIHDHNQLAVPNPGSYISGNTTSGQNKLQAYAPTYFPVFTNDDIGRLVHCAAFPTGTTITGVNNALEAVLSTNATVTASGQQFTIDRPERWMTQLRHGAVDPATGIYYCATSDDTAPPPGVAAPRYGLFQIPQVGGSIQTVIPMVDGLQSVIVEGGKVLAGPYVFTARR